jgi:hypothetical protein
MEFPTDDVTLSMLRDACDPGPDVERSSMFDFLDLMGTTERVIEEHDNVRVVEQDVPSPSPQQVMVALIDALTEARAARRDLLWWIDQQITGIRRSSLPEFSAGALHAFEKVADRMRSVD